MLAGDTIAAIDLQVVDANGEPVSRIEVGDEFVLRGSAHDSREDGGGVFAAYTDVTYDETLVAVDGPLQIASGFPAGRSGDAEVPGQIDEVGGFRQLQDGNVDTTQKLLFEIPFIAKTGGEILFATNPAELVPAHDVLLLGLDFPVLPPDVEYGYVRLQIGDPGANPPSPWRNPNHPFDVNDDGTVSVADAQLIEEEIAARGERTLPAPVDGDRPPPFFDVTGEGQLRQDDLALINDQFAPDRTTPPPPAPRPSPMPSIFAQLRDLLPQLEDDAFHVRVEVINTRTGENDSTTRVGDVLNVRGFLGGLDTIPSTEFLRPALALVILSGAATHISYDPQAFTAFPTIGGFAWETSPINQIQETGESPFFSVQFVALQPGTSTLTTQFHDEPGSEGLALFAPTAVAPGSQLPDWADLVEQLERTIEPASETIEVVAQEDRPTTSDDRYQFEDTTPLVVSDAAGLLANDTFSTATGTAVAQLVGPPAKGNVTVEADGSFVYAPLYNYDGSDQFHYVIVTDEATSNLASVSISGELPPVVGVVLRAIDRQGEPLESVRVGQSFFVQGTVEDLRAGSTGEARGVFSVDLRLSFDSRFASLDGAVEINPRYDAFSFGQATAEGEIIDVRGHSGLSQTGLGEHEVFRIPMVATAAGDANVTIEEIRSLQLMRFGGDVPENLADVAVSDIQIEAGSRWQNPARSMDANNDGFVTPHDVLFGVNMLNRHGAAALDDSMMEMNGHAVYVDTNGDGFHTPADVRIVVNHLNAAFKAIAEGESAAELGAAGTSIVGGELAPSELNVNPEPAPSVGQQATAYRSGTRVVPSFALPADQMDQPRQSPTSVATPSPFDDEDLLDEIENWLRP